jgi:hypothetical protein
MGTLEVADHLLDIGIKLLVTCEGAARIDVERIDILEFLPVDLGALRYEDLAISLNQILGFLAIEQTENLSGLPFPGCSNAEIQYG